MERIYQIAFEVNRTKTPETDSLAEGPKKFFFNRFFQNRADHYAFFDEYVTYYLDMGVDKCALYESAFGITDLVHTLTMPGFDFSQDPRKKMEQALQNHLDSFSAHDCDDFEWDLAQFRNSEEFNCKVPFKPLPTMKMQVGITGSPNFALKKLVDFSKKSLDN